MSILNAKLSKLGVQLPEITGENEQQIGYASDLRAKYLSRYVNYIETYIKLNAKVNDTKRKAEFVAYCKSAGFNPEEEIKKEWEYSGLATVKLMMEENDAKAIIDGYTDF